MVTNFLTSQGTVRHHSGTEFWHWYLHICV